MKNKHVINAGDVFGRFLIIEELETVRSLNKALRFFQCRCSCGAERKVRIDHLTQGRVVSCGCYAQDRRTKHGKWSSGVYLSWKDMKARCKGSSAWARRYYVAAGITVCERWLDFNNFYADMGDRPKGLELDRIDNTKGYSPENCRWSTRSTQMINQRKRAGSLSKYKGVSKNRNKWVASFSRTGAHKYLGSFETEEGARAAYVAYCELNGFEYCK